MNTNVLNEEELNKIIITLKEKEIYYHIIKIVRLSQSIFLHPEKTIYSIKLHKSLERLDYLLTA